MNTDRDTHFIGHAESIYPELARLFHAMYASRILGNEAQAKKAETWIKQYLAHCSYDLACHVISETIGIGNTTEGIVKDIPDLQTLREDRG